MDVLWNSLECVTLEFFDFSSLDFFFHAHDFISMFCVALLFP